MDPRLAAYLSGRVPAARELVNWIRADVRFEVAAHLTADPPPLDLVTSVRAIVRDGDGVLVFDSEDGTHAAPGGRREPGESPVDAVRRELEEELGCRPQIGRQLGILHFHHLTPRPDGYRYPYPDFVQVVYAATVGRDAVSDRADPLVRRPRFVPLTDARELALPAVELAFLSRAT